MPDIHDMELDARPSPQDICEHNQDSIETGEDYYGREENQYTKYFFCGDCGIEIDWEPDEDLMRGKER